MRDELIGRGVRRCPPDIDNEIEKATFGPIREPQHLGAMVRSLREAHGMTRGQLSEAAGVGPQTIGAIERGYPQTYGRKVRSRLAGSLGLAPAQLLSARQIYRRDIG